MKNHQIRKKDYFPQKRLCLNFELVGLEILEKLNKQVFEIFEGLKKFMEEVNSFILEAVHQTDFTENTIVIVADRSKFSEIKKRIFSTAEDLECETFGTDKSCDGFCINGVKFVFSTPQEIKFFGSQDGSSVPIEFWDDESIDDVFGNGDDEKLGFARNSLIGEFLEIGGINGKEDSR